MCVDRQCDTKSYVQVKSEVETIALRHIECLLTTLYIFDAIFVSPPTLQPKTGNLIVAQIVFEQYYYSSLFVKTYYQTYHKELSLIT